MSNDTPMVRIRSLRKSFGSHVVLKGIDFDVQPSQVVVVIGPSGSGKSTFLGCCNEGMTMMVVTHEMDVAREVGDAVVVMDDGGIIEAGPPDTIFTNPSQDRTRSFLQAVLTRA